MNMRKSIAFLLFASAIGTTACNNNSQFAGPQPVLKMFSEADVTKAQGEITHDYQNKGFEVEQVSLTRILTDTCPGSSSSGRPRASSDLS
jgi:hypothetical protein